VYMKKGTVGAI